MSDDIHHTGRADIHHPKGPLTGAQQPLSRDEQWTYDYLRRVAAHDSPRWDVAAREIEARVRADALRQAAQMLVTQPHVLDEIACANLLEAVARETTCGPNCREAHTYATECAAPRAVAAGEEQPMPDASRDAVELAARILFEAGQVATDEETWQGITGDDRDSYRRVARAQLDAVATASHLRGEPAARDARVRAGALRSFAASMRAPAEQAPEGEPAAWPWTAYALAAVKAEEYAGKGFPSDAADRTPDVGTPDPQRYWWQHDDCDSGPVAGAADWPGRPCSGCGMSLGGWTRGAPIAADAP